MKIKFKEKILKAAREKQKNNIQGSPGSAESPIQDKPKEKHVKTHINQTDKKNLRQKKY